MDRTEAEIRAFLEEHKVGSMSYNSIRASIIGSTGDYGLMSCYEGEEGQEIWFVNGQPQQIKK